MMHFEAYIDESGNTGIDLFDKRQPFFWTGTMVVTQGVRFPCDITSIAQKVGSKELHGSKLGLRRINEIAKQLIDIIETLNARFMFTRVEKSHISAMRLADALFDNVNNPAVTAFHYNVPFNKKMLAYYVDIMMDEKDRKDFWNIHLAGDSEEFREFLIRFRSKIERQFPKSNQRGRQLVLDAIAWGIKEPDSLLSERTKKPEGIEDFRSLQYESPNLVSITTLLHGLHYIAEEYEMKATKIIHDEQSEFGKYIQHSFSLLKRIRIDQSNQFLLHEVKDSDTILAELELGSSANSPFLQIVDVVLWMMTQKVDKGKDIMGNARNLMNCIISRSNIFHFSSKHLEADLKYSFNEIMSKPITQQKMQSGIKAMEKLEASRQQQMRENNLLK
ncbi:hypothetical protein DFQ01_110132 [Paenibacillus cellulosilyticus]|uniref:DUF3800 domain-containing protein n=1 Tax=Paenibacillus cellulosilyticus TaxID=375489 RepID=A0A2V2YSN9_9BACL|nr:DUF3800 domain-containing protein [Paenibacillus cellulosilyticus]PWW01242.1 hypothetical protein DFQ01_110132 [Paenibacillus cellulosilyticus]QKS46806.1 DUF3800 domain-containing protein [Paenibacillus cellulosilyticus]